MSFDKEHDNKVKLKKNNKFLSLEQVKDNKIL